MAMEKRVWDKWKEWVVIAIGLVMAVRSGMTIWRLWKTGERVKEAQQEVIEATKENQRLKEKLAEVNSPEFVEREAKDKLGYGRPGETILVIPEQKEQESRKVEGSESEPNWKKWWKLYGI